MYLFQEIFNDIIVVAVVGHSSSQLYNILCESIHTCARIDAVFYSNETYILAYLHKYLYLIVIDL